MKKLLLCAILALATLPVFGQSKIYPLPTTMVKYIGKITKSEFEKIIGAPILSQDETHFTYQVTDTYGKSTVFMECAYRSADSVLVYVNYPSKIYKGYKESFMRLPGYQKSDIEYWEAPHIDPWFLVYEEIFTLTMTRGNFRCEILKEYGLNYAVKYSWVK